MDTRTKRRLALGFLSNWVSKLAGSVVQLVQVPVFLHFWSVPLYGEWVVLNAVPAYLAFSNIGFGSVAGNEMTMREAAGDREGALRVFQSCWWLIAGICGLVALGFAAVLAVVPLHTLQRLSTHSLLHTSTISDTDARWILLYLGLSVLLGQFEQLMGAAYTCVGRYPYGSFLKSAMSLAAFAAMMVPVAMGRGPRATAAVFAAANIASTVLFGILTRRDIPWLRYGGRYARWSEIRRLSAPAFAFMGFPLGNALNLQGTLLVVGYALGPLDVVVFSTARTVSRVALQMVQMVNNTFWPELSAAFGAGDAPLLRALHRRACQLALIVAGLLVAAAVAGGPWFLTHWTAGHVPPSRGLLSILLLVVVFYSLWSTSSTLLIATNRHQRLALYYVCATALTVALTYVLARRAGLYGAAASLLLSEIIMNAVVLPNSLRLAGDTFSGFLAGLLHWPAALHPSAMLRRLQRSSPKLES